MATSELENLDRRGLPLGVLALNQGLVSAGQLLDALAEQANETARGRGTRRLGDILIERGKITQAQLNDLLKNQKADTESARRREKAISTALPAAPIKGPTIFGKFLLVRELNRGTTGVVYEALDSNEGVKVALKIFFADTDDPAALLARERFIREARLSTRLPTHPNIVKVFEAGITQDRRFLVMEFIEGPDMASWLKKGPPKLRQKIELLSGVARAIHHTHEHGILHRDLKPQNILVDVNTLPRIVDFGLAKSIRRTGSEPLTISGMLVGTPAYMSPEQAQAEREIDRRTDVYSLGVMLYEILASRIPFGEKATVMTLMKIVSEPPPPPSSVANAVDPTLEALCLGAMAKDPKDRPPTALAFAEELAAWLGA